MAKCYVRQIILWKKQLHIVTTLYHFIDMNFDMKAPYIKAGIINIKTSIPKVIGNTY